MVSLGVNIDHVATLRNARGGDYPDPIKAALLAEENGADGITAHLREDRRHIKDADLKNLKAAISTRLNMEMANTEEMVGIALQLKPYMVTLVPERREEVTTEGGLDVVRFESAILGSTKQLQDAGILVSLFITPELAQIEASQRTGAELIEFHTGPYCEAFYHQKTPPQEELKALLDGAKTSQALGLRVNAGHGLNVDNVQPILAMAGLEELNIGHSLIGDAIYMGLGEAVRRMKQVIS
jgi:pyridoxine 5-phosphate synthase